MEASWKGTTGARPLLVGVKREMEGEEGMAAVSSSTTSRLTVTPKRKKVRRQSPASSSTVDKGDEAIALTPSLKSILTNDSLARHICSFLEGMPEGLYGYLSISRCCKAFLTIPLKSHLQAISTRRSPSSLLKALERHEVPNLSSLSLTIGHPHTFTLGHILSNLKENKRGGGGLLQLDLEGSDLSAEEQAKGVSPIVLAAKNGSLQRLEVLSLASTEIDLNDLTCLLECFEHSMSPHLRHLDLSRLELTMGAEGHPTPFPHEKVGRAICHLPKLSDLYLCGTGMGRDQAMAYVPALSHGRVPHLSFLDLTDNQLQAGGLEVILAALSQPMSPRLTCLSIENNDLGNEGASILCEYLMGPSFARLQQLDLEDNAIDSEGFESLCPYLMHPNASSLKGLYCGCQDIGVKGVLLLTQAIEEDKLLNLERLFLDRVLESAAIEEDHSTHTEFEGCISSLIAAIDGNHSPQLRELSLEQHGPRRTGNQQRNGLMWKEGMMMTVAQRQRGVATFPSLGQHHYQPVGGLCRMRALHIGGLLQGGMMVRALTSALTAALPPQGVMNLRKLSLDSSNLGLSGGLHLLRFLEGGACPYLEELFFDTARIVDSMCGPLGRALHSPGLQRLKTLDLTGNHLTSKGIIAFTSAILEGGHCNVRLETLVLKSNLIDSSGVDHLLRLVTSPHLHLRVLNLSRNPVDLSGIQMAVKAVLDGRCSRLNVLDLSHSHRLTDRGRSLLAAQMNEAIVPVRGPVLRLYTPTKYGLGLQALVSISRSKEWLNLDLLDG